jgi:hypothetical protein
MSDPSQDLTANDPWVVRTDFSDESNWASVRDQIAAPQTEFGMPFYAYVQYVSDAKYDGVPCNDLVRMLPETYPGGLLFIVDQRTLNEKDHPILVVEFARPGAGEKDSARRPSDTPEGDIRMFRAIPSTIQSIQNNLSIANMSFDEFARHIDDDGVFRTFPE